MELEHDWRLLFSISAWKAWRGATPPPQFDETKQIEAFEQEGFKPQTKPIKQEADKANLWLGFEFGFGFGFEFPWFGCMGNHPVSSTQLPLPGPTWKLKTLWLHRGYKVGLLSPPHHPLHPSPSHPPPPPHTHPLHPTQSDPKPRGNSAPSPAPWRWSAWWAPRWRRGSPWAWCPSTPWSPSARLGSAQRSPGAGVLSSSFLFFSGFPFFFFSSFLLFFGGVLDMKKPNF